MGKFEMAKNPQMTFDNGYKVSISSSNFDYDDYTSSDAEVFILDPSDNCINYLYQSMVVNFGAISPDQLVDILIFTKSLPNLEKAVI